MRISLAAALFLFGWAHLLAQAPGSAPAAAPVAAPATAQPSAGAAKQPAAPASSATSPQVQRSDIGFSYRLPPDWEVVAPARAATAETPYHTLAASKKGDACVEVAFTAKHGAPASVVVILALPFSCYGQAMKTSDLKNLGAGAAEGMKQTFEVTEAVEGNYSLGSHAVWIERAKGTPKYHPESRFTFEIACTVLEKGAACWMAMAADAAGLHEFEEGMVSLDNESPAALVPATAFPNKSS